MELKNDKIDYKFFLKLFSPFKGIIFLFFATNFSIAALHVFRSYCLKKMLDCIVNFDPVANSAYQFIFSWVLVEIFFRAKRYVSVFLTPKIKQYSMEIFSKRILRYEDFFFQKNNPTAILNGLRNVSDGFDEILFSLKALLSRCIFIISSLISLYFVGIEFFQIGVVWVFLSFLISYISGKKGHLLAYKIYELRRTLSSHLGDLFFNISIIKTFNCVEFESENVKNLTKKVEKAEIYRNKKFFLYSLIQGIIFANVISIVFYLLISKYYAKQITIGDFSMTIDLFQVIYFNLDDLTDSITEISEMTGRVQEGLDLIYQEIRDSNLKRLPKMEPKKEIELTFKNIAYKYPDSNSNEYDFVLNEELKFHSNMTVAIVGPSGGGKSTFFKLMLGIIQPKNGKILINNENIFEKDVASVRDFFALIPQEYGLFNQSIRDNIKYGSFDASDEEMIKAAKKAQIHSVIMALPKQYDTIFGTDVNFSGGQKQRIVIARGLLKKAQIFLFDEFTSALDAKTESDVFASIATEVDCLKFIIAHRLSTVKNADMILVFNKGCLIEKGTHEELIAKKAFYYELMNFA